MLVVWYTVVGDEGLGFNPSRKPIIVPSHPLLLRVGGVYGLLIKIVMIT